MDTAVHCLQSQFIIFGRNEIRVSSCPTGQVCFSGREFLLKNNFQNAFAKRIGNNTNFSLSNHLQIMSKAKTVEERHFYISLCVKEKYSARELERQMDSAYYERYMLSSKKVLPEHIPRSVRGSIFDTYVLEFLDLPEQFSERNLRKAIIENLKQFILEFGKDFTFIGEEYRVQVGGQDFYIDLLFYNRALSCLVPIKLKIGKFKPEHIGQINFYLEALDRDVKKPNENPSVGVILCAGKDDAVVEYLSLIHI